MKRLILIALLITSCKPGTPKPQPPAPYVYLAKQEVIDHATIIMTPELPKSTRLLPTPGTNHLYSTNIIFSWTFPYKDNETLYTSSNIVFIVRSNNNPSVDRHKWPVVAVTKALSYTQFNTGLDNEFHGYVITASNTVWKTECNFQ